MNKEKCKEHSTPRLGKVSFLLLTFVLCLASCRHTKKTSQPWVKPESITVNCNEYFSIETEHGVLNNNVWNKYAAEDDDWSQCLEKRKIDSTYQYGWSWSWPTSRRVIYAYPQIKMGSSPWLPEPKFDARFPLQISTLKDLEISHEVDIIANGNFNVATTMWLVDEPNKGSQANSDIIAAEIMIWTYATEKHFDPAGKKYGEFVDANHTWEVWFDKNWTDQSGQNENQWVNITFKAKEYSFKSQIDVAGILGYAVKEDLLSPHLLIADIELGNEVMSGSGLTWVKSFDMRLEIDNFRAP